MADDDRLVLKDGKILRRGFTTGSCAAAAAAAAARMLRTGEVVSESVIKTPGGMEFHAQVIPLEDGRPLYYSCAVIKDAGDDPDITNGTQIVARVSRDDCAHAAGGTHNCRVRIIGGEGVGRVTRPGLDQPVGEAAINRVPREMIRENVERVLDAWQKSRKSEPAINEVSAPGRLIVEISVPEGRALAEKTFNPRLGIVGGISILGTTGIVEPMSEQALVDTIRAQIRMKRAAGRKAIIAAPGNYGMAFLRERYGVSEDEPVMISNFVRDAVRIACEEGVEQFLLAGHIGKLVKVAGGVPNTHSRFGDRRMEILWEVVEEVLTDRGWRTPQAAWDLSSEAQISQPTEGKKRIQFGQESAEETQRLQSSEEPGSLQYEQRLTEEMRSAILACVTTDAALELLDQYEQLFFGLKADVMRRLAARILNVLREWSGGALQTEAIVFAGQREELARTAGAEELLAECVRLQDDR